MPELGRDDSKAPFNMAIATLERLSEILREISQISSDSNLSLAQRQSIIVPKVKQFFLQSSPLLPESIVEKYKNEIISLKPKQQEIIRTKHGMKRNTEVRLIYDIDLDNKINEYIIIIQRELQKEKYFMPPRKDLSKSVTEMY